MQDLLLHSKPGSDQQRIVDVFRDERVEVRQMALVDRGLGWQLGVPTGYVRCSFL